MLLLIVLSILLGLVTILPEVYSAYKFRKFWLPVNALPIMVGDDYHYFSILNRLHSKFSIRGRKNNLFSTFSRANKSQMIPQLINLIPFAIGTKLLDARFGILLVRFTNRVSLFVFSAILSEIVCAEYLNIHVPLWNHLVQGLLLYLVFPGPVTLHIRKSLLGNLANSHFIFEKNRTSDINRAYVLETVLPLFIASVAWVITNFSDNSKFVAIFMVLLVVNILAYPPIGVAFLSQSISIFIFNDYSKWQIAVFAILGSILLLSIQKYIQSDSYGKETYSENKLSRFGFFLGKWACAEVLVNFVFLVFVFLIFGEVVSLAFGVTILSLFNLTTHHNLSRIWYRGGAPISQFYSIIFLVSLISSLSRLIFFLVFGFAVFALVFFYTRQTKILFRESYFAIPKEYQSLNKFIFNNSRAMRNLTIVSNDSEFLKLLSIYSKLETVGTHHGLNDNDFKAQLELAATSYILLGLDFQQFRKDHTFNFNYFDFLAQRSYSFNLPKKYHIFAHSRQMFDSYYLFNDFLLVNGYFYNGKFSHKYVENLSDIWKSVAVADTVLLLEKKNNLVKVLRCDDEPRNAFSISCNTNFE